MKALILAGGLATRLRPVSEKIPKVLMPIGDVPFIAYQLASLRAQGVTRAVLCAGFLADVLQRELGNGKQYGVELSYRVEPQPMGTGGALLFSKDEFEDETLVLNGDTYVDIDLAGMRERHRKLGSDLTIALTAWNPEQKDVGLIQIDENQRITRFAEKDNFLNGERFVNAGFYLFSKKLFEAEYKMPCSLEYDLIPQWIKNFSVNGFPQPSARLFDIGTPERIKVFQQYAEERKLLC